MKTDIRLIWMLCLAMLIACLTNCSSDEIFLEKNQIPDGERIMLSYSFSGSKAGEDVGFSIENQVNTLEVLIFGTGGERVHYQKDTYENVSEGSIILTKSKSEFDTNAYYTIHLVANAQQSLENIQTLSQLEAGMETNEFIHLTTINEYQRFFLMHGTSLPLILNDGGEENVQECIELIRAAVKIEVTLTLSSSEGFTPSAGSEFRIVNLQTASRYIYNAEDLPDDTSLKTTDFTSSCINEEDLETSGTVTLITYAYPNNWQSELENHITYLIVDIPYKEKPENTGNYYRIPVTSTTVSELKANHHYKVNAVIDAKGSENVEEPEMLKDIKYGVVDWMELSVPIGGEDVPHYLTVDKNNLVMRGIEKDSISFASSHEISIIGFAAYYYNKYNEEKVDNSVSANIVTWDDYRGGFLRINSSLPSNNLVRYIEFDIKHTNCGESSCQPVHVVIEQYPTEYITSYLGWHSYRDDFTTDGIPNWETACNITNIKTIENAIRYVRWYKDWESEWRRQVTSQSIFKQDGSTTYKNPGAGFFKSKVARQPKDDDGITEWQEGDAPESSFSSKTIPISQFGWNHVNDKLFLPDTDNDYNPRMYQINITSSKKPEYTITSTMDGVQVVMDYDVGIPRLDGQGYTESSAANNRLVSPSFIIASRLGAVSAKANVTLEDETGAQIKDDDDNPQKQEVIFMDTTEDGWAVAAEHCARYVEVYLPRDKDGIRIPGAEPVTLKDWRLPTPAELRILIYYQGEPDSDTEALDYALPGTYFWTSDKNGPIYNWNNNENNSGSIGLRCVHDVYNMTNTNNQ